MPDGGGESVIRRVLAEHPDVRFLALSVSDAPEDVIAVIRAGARGYVTKAISGPELVEAIQRIADDDPVFSRRLAGFVLDAFAQVPVDAVDPELDQLTPRERTCAPDGGYAYKEIARAVDLD
jgi:DNA-binding NarL/FixJ family response regulator